jgi:Tol biopolymer transport system component
MEQNEVFNNPVNHLDSENNRNKPRSRLKKMLLGLALLGLMTVAGLAIIAYFTLGQIWPANLTAGQIAPIFITAPVTNEIAVVGNDKNVWLVSPDGRRRQEITQNGRGYKFPTWSPDGRRLAFIGPDDDDNAALFVSPTGQPGPTILYNTPGSSPFYLYWSPDSAAITFLTQEKSELAMRLADIRQGESRLLGTGAPFYWAWSPVGDKLLMHVGGSRAVSDKAHLSILENHVDASRVELDLAPGGFQAPDWSSDGSLMFYIATNHKGESSIFKTNASNLEQTPVAKLDGFAYMVLAPDDTHLAYLQIEKNDRAPFGSAYLVSVNGAVPRRLTDELVGSMYWSPDGSKLALLTLSLRNDGPTAKTPGLAAPLPQEIVFRWLIYHVDTDTLDVLASFSPTPDFLQTVPYFDQYHRSLTFWSPDSRYFVITKENEGDNTGGTVWVLDTTGQTEPQQISEGTLAVWSWQ